MSAFTSELQNLLRLYVKLTHELSPTENELEKNDPAAFVECVLRNRAGLLQIENMNSRVLELAGEWQACRDNCDPKVKEETEALAESARNQALRLIELCKIHAQRLENVRVDLDRKLEETQKGARFLVSIKPVRSNYPKFVDSLG